jgi:protein-tyrosine-phosphatase
MTRSQIAEAFFNYYYPKSFAESAGTLVGLLPGEPAGQRLADIPSQRLILNEMKRMGFDLSDKQTKYITKEMADGADKIVVMVEKGTWPNYLLNNNKMVEWSVYNSDFSNVKDAIKTIKKLVITSPYFH